MAAPDALVCTINCLVKLGKARTEAVTKACFRCVNEVSASGDHLKASFLRRLVK
ncbi:hypothetical protein A2U01_0062204, partial [Trifolium medium]|nr:hypothetical protein [Trifolium medium]